MRILLQAAGIFRWTRHSRYLFGAFILTILLIGYIWWPLAEEALAYLDWNGPWWRYFDWLLVGNFLVMSLLIVAGANLRNDASLVLIGAVGGLVIESWGTQTSLWSYYTNERPPLWIIPAWPVATLAIDRLVRVLQALAGAQSPKKASFFRLAYLLIFCSFYALMLSFVWPTLDKSLTQLALLLCALIILSPGDPRAAILAFIAGAGLGYFLEVWGTTRECWTYYSLQTPPLFAVLAHGMAAVAFWRVGLVFHWLEGVIYRSKRSVVDYG